MPPGSTQKQEHKLLFAAFIFGNLTLVIGMIGLFFSRDLSITWQFNQTVLDNVSLLILDAVRILLLDPPDITNVNGWLIAARFCAVLFAATGVTGIVLEISQVAGDQLLKLKYSLMQLFKKKPAVVVGNEAIGTRLSLQIRKQGRPVYLFTTELETDSDGLIELRNAGVLVVSESLIEHLKTRKNSSYLHKANEIFLTMSDDSRNLELAGDIIERMPDVIDGKHNRNCYIHIGDPELTKTVRDHHILSDHQKDIAFNLFSITNATATSLSIQLFLDQGIGLLSEVSTNTSGNKKGLPLSIQKDEVFHLFLFGFGKIAQAVVLTVARFAHFASGKRTRVTIFGEKEKGLGPWESFLQKYPAIAPLNLDLTGDTFKQVGDGWDQNPARPFDSDFCTRDRYPDGRTVVEYALNAEYLPIWSEIHSSDLVEAVRCRLSQTTPGIQVAVVIAADDERDNFHNALRFQKKMARTLMDDKSGKDQQDHAPCKVRDQFWKNLCPLPIFAYLPTETGLMHILHNGAVTDEWAIINRQLPTHGFGELSELIDYDFITRGGLKQMAKQIQEVYKILAQKDELRHVDFTGSDMDSILFTEVKMEALGISFSSQRHSGQKPMLDEYFSDDVDSALKNFRSRSGLQNGKMILNLDEMETIMEKSDSAEKLLVERMAIMGRLKLKNKENMSVDENDKFAGLKKQAVLNVLGRFTITYNEQKGNSTKNRDDQDTIKADLAAEMEHNRWMGERLAKNWRYGPHKSNFHNERPTFVPWKELTEDERFYDRQQVPRVILAQRETGLYAYVS